MIELKIDGQPAIELTPQRVLLLSKLAKYASATLRPPKMTSTLLEFHVQDAESYIRSRTADEMNDLATNVMRPLIEAVGEEA